MALPVLYSFRRCPYAMRARMAIAYSGNKVELREVALKEKPEALLQASAKGTVPVLVLENGEVIDESLDIMYWALSRHDPDHWLALTSDTKTESQQLINENDTVFKPYLDHYKYADRYPQHSTQYYRVQGETFLAQLEKRLSAHSHLLGSEISLVDIALFPFIRQFAHVDKDWFDQAPYPCLQAWLEALLGSELFNYVMKKYPPWDTTQNRLIF